MTGRVRAGRDKRTSGPLVGGRVPENCFGVVVVADPHECGELAVEHAFQSMLSLGLPSSRSRCLASESSRASVSRPLPQDAASWFLSHEASAGLSPPVDTEIVTAPSRWTAGRINEQWAGSSALFTHTPAASASAATAPSTSGSPVAVMTRRKPAMSPGR